MTHPLRTLLYELFVEPIVELWQERRHEGAPPLRSRFWSDRVGGPTSSFFTADLAALPVASAPPASTSEKPKESYEHSNV